MKLMNLQKPYSNPIELPTLIIELLVGFNQSAQVSFNLEAFDYSVSGTSIVFGGLEGNFKANSDLSAEFDLAVGRLQVIEPKTSSGFTLEGLSLSTTTEQINNLLSPSHTVMTIPSMNSSGPFPLPSGESAPPPLCNHQTPALII